MGCEKKEVEPSPIPKGENNTGKWSRGKGKKLTLLEARCTDDPCMVPKWCQGPRETSWTHKKVENFYLRNNEGGFLPNFCRIKYIWNSLNSTNILQKSVFKDKGGEEINKVRKNILECLAGNRIVVGIRMRSVLINKEEEVEREEVPFRSREGKEGEQPWRKRENV